MAKAQTETTETDDTATETPAVSVGRAIILTLDAEHAALVGVDVGSTMKRTDYIRARWQAGVARGPISKEVSTIQGTEVAYQIIFQATKGIEGGPVKTEKHEAPATEFEAA